MNITIIIVIIVIAVGFNVYNFLKLKKRSMNSKVKENSQTKYKHRLPDTKPKQTPQSSPARYNNYHTKYNSQEDYRELPKVQKSHQRENSENEEKFE